MMDDLAKRRLSERFGLAGDATPKPEYERLPLREVPLEPIARALKDAADEIKRLRAQLAERDRDADRLLDALREAMHQATEYDGLDLATIGPQHWYTKAAAIAASMAKTP